MKKQLDHCKISCPNNPKLLKEYLEMLGFKVPESDYFIVSGNTLVPLTAEQYAAINNPEVDNDKFFAAMEKYKLAKTKYKPGQVLLFDNEELVLVIRDEGVAVRALTLSDSVGAISWYTKERLHLVSASKRSAFLKQLKDCGYDVRFVDGELDDFYLRWRNQEYFYVAGINFREKKPIVHKALDIDQKVDRVLAACGNYFKNFEDAVIAFGTVVSNSQSTTE